ncbi:AsmA-like C-terminal domain-containing protein [Helicobacter saguini]|nr:AsmA-like C-terminal domain-containing protein [Helicobacter saguini]
MKRSVIMPRNNDNADTFINPPSDKLTINNTQKQIINDNVEPKVIDNRESSLQDFRESMKGLDSKENQNIESNERSEKSQESIGIQNLDSKDSQMKVNTQSVVGGFGGLQGGIRGSDFAIQATLVPPCERVECKDSKLKENNIESNDSVNSRSETKNVENKKDSIESNNLQNLDSKNAQDSNILSPAHHPTNKEKETPIQDQNKKPKKKRKKALISLSATFIAMLVTLFISYKVLAKGIYIENLNIANIDINNIFLQLNNKLTLTIDSITLNDTQKEDNTQPPNLKEIINYTQKALYVLSYFETLEINEITLSPNNHLQISYANGHYDISSNLFDAKFNVTDNKNSFFLSINEFNLKNIPAHLEGDFTFNIPNKTLEFDIKAILDSKNEWLSLKGNTDFENIVLNGKSSVLNDLDELKPFINAIEKPSLKATLNGWLYEKVKYKEMKIDSISANINLNNITQSLLKNLFVKLHIYDARVSLNKGNTPILSPEVILEFKDASLNITPLQPTLAGMNLSGSSVLIKGMPTPDVIVNLNGSNVRLDSNLAGIIKSYGLTLPVSQDSLKSSVKSMANVELDSKTYTQTQNEIIESVNTALTPKEPAKIDSKIRVVESKSEIKNIFTNKDGVSLSMQIVIKHNAANPLKPLFSLNGLVQAANTQLSVYKVPLSASSLNVALDITPTASLIYINGNNVKWNKIIDGNINMLLNGSARNIKANMFVKNGVINTGNLRALRLMRDEVKTFNTQNIPELDDTDDLDEAMGNSPYPQQDSIKLANLESRFYKNTEYTNLDSKNLENIESRFYKNIESKNSRSEESQKSIGIQNLDSINSQTKVNTRSVVGGLGGCKGGKGEQPRVQRSKLTLANSRPPYPPCERVDLENKKLSNNIKESIDFVNSRSETKNVDNIESRFYKNTLDSKKLQNLISIESNNKDSKNNGIYLGDLQDSNILDSKAIKTNFIESNKAITLAANDKKKKQTTADDDENVLKELKSNPIWDDLKIRTKKTRPFTPRTDKELEIIALAQLNKEREPFSLEQDFINMKNTNVLINLDYSKDFITLNVPSLNLNLDTKKGLHIHVSRIESILRHSPIARFYGLEHGDFTLDVIDSIESTSNSSHTQQDSINLANLESRFYKNTKITNLDSKNLENIESKNSRSETKDVDNKIDSMQSCANSPLPCGGGLGGWVKNPNLTKNQNTKLDSKKLQNLDSKNVDISTATLPTATLPTPQPPSAREGGYIHPTFKERKNANETIESKNLVIASNSEAIHTNKNQKINNIDCHDFTTQNLAMTNNQDSKKVIESNGIYISNLGDLQDSNVIKSEIIKTNFTRHIERSEISNIKTIESNNQDSIKLSQNTDISPTAQHDSIATSQDSTNKDSQNKTQTTQNNKTKKTTATFTLNLKDLSYPIYDNDTHQKLKNITLKGTFDGTSLIILGNDNIDFKSEDGLSLLRLENYRIDIDEIYDSSIPFFVDLLKDKQKDLPYSDAAIRQELRLLNIKQKLRKKLNVNPIDFNVLGKNMQFSFLGYTAPFDMINLRFIDGRIAIDGQYEKGIMNANMIKDSIHIRAKNFSGAFVNMVLMSAKDGKKMFDGGTFSLDGLYRDSILNATLEIQNTSVLEFKALQNVFAFIDTLPSLVMFKNPHLGSGYQISYGKVLFATNSDYVGLQNIFLLGNSMDINGQGIIDKKSEEMNVNLSITTIKNLGKFINKIPIVGYLILGRKGEISTNLILSGKYTDPKVNLTLATDIIKMPLNILRRVFPVEMLNESIQNAEDMDINY